jgi:hypothetical protein
LQHPAERPAAAMPSAPINPLSEFQLDDSNKKRQPDLPIKPAPQSGTER